jgi:Domain of unknown function (DUF4345)
MSQRVVARITISLSLRKKGETEMTLFTLYGAGLTMLVVGALHLFAPQMMMEEPMIVLSSVNHFHVIRAGYGGAFLGIATLFLLGALRIIDSRTALIAVAVLFGGFAIGRIFSIAVDGIPVTRYLAVLATEVFFAACALWALRKASV